MGTARQGNEASSNPQKFIRAGRIVAMALFDPRIAAEVIAAVAPLFPKAGPVGGHEFDAANPLRTLPRIEAGHHEPDRETVVR
jgi:hypothetical protein